MSGSSPGERGDLLQAWVSRLAQSSARAVDKRPAPMALGRGALELPTGAPMSVMALDRFGFGTQVNRRRVRSEHGSATSVSVSPAITDPR
jgi:hypothetical protein